MAGAMTGRGRVGGLIGRVHSGSVTGNNYFVDASGTNGIGVDGGSCSSSVCVRKTATQIAALTSALGWTVNTIWATGNWNFGTATQFPAVLYSGANCETISGTNHINRNDGDARHTRLRGHHKGAEIVWIKTGFVDKTSFACFCDKSGDSGRLREKALCIGTFFVRLTITGFGG